MAVDTVAVAATGVTVAVTVAATVAATGTTTTATGAATTTSTTNIGCRPHGRVKGKKVQLPPEPPSPKKQTLSWMDRLNGPDDSYMESWTFREVHKFADTQTGPDATIIKTKFPTGFELFRTHRPDMISMGLSAETIDRIVQKQDERIRPLAHLLYTSSADKTKPETYYWENARKILEYHGWSLQTYY